MLFMMNLRFYAALWTAKVIRQGLKISGHQGTNAPGKAAMRICPDFLKYIGKPKKIWAITGTNGKTTVTNIVCEMLENEGRVFLNNREGSNTKTGMATCLIKGSNILGHAKYDMGVFEIDERSAPRIYPFLEPDCLVITNLFRDSIMRNAHPEFIAGVLSDYIPKKTRLIVNAEDLISNSVAPGNTRAYYGIDRLPSDRKECINLVNDMRVCPKCGARLAYDYVRYHHIGKAHCPACGFKSPESDYTAIRVDYNEKTLTVRDAEGEGKYDFLNDSTFNLYNLAAVVALFRENGYSHEAIAGLLKTVSIPSTRFKKEQIGDISLVLQASKETNALASTMAITYVAQQPGHKNVLLMMNSLYDEKYWSENICWMYDCDFEFLNDPSIGQIVVAGPRYLDYRLRLLIAGIPEEKIAYFADEREAAQMIALEKGDTIYVLHGMDSYDLYTDVLDVIRKRAVEVQK